MEKIVSPIWSKEGELAQNLVGEKERDMDVEPGMKSDTEVLISIPDVEMVQLCDVDKEGEQNIVIEPDLILLSDMNAETATHSESSEEQSSDDKEMSTAPFPAKQMLVKSSNKDASRKKVQVKEELMEEDCAIQNEGSRKQSGKSSLTSASKTRYSDYPQRIHKKCSKCGNSFFLPLLLKLHEPSGEESQQCRKCILNTVLSDLLVFQSLQVPKEEDLKCVMCGKQFKIRSDLMVHLRSYIAERPYKCDQCGKLFLNESYIKKHIRTEHNHGNLQICDTCGNIFPSKELLKEHMKVHVTDCTLKCDQCDMKFTNKNILRKHIKTHIDGGPWKCKLCEKVFHNKSALTVHEKRHLPEQPVQCHLCPIFFSNKTHLRKHLKRHSEKHVHTCHVCDKTFSDKKALHSHMFSHKTERIKDNNGMKTMSSKSETKNIPDIRKTEHNLKERDNHCLKSLLSVRLPSNNSNLSKGTVLDKQPLHIEEGKGTSILCHFCPKMFTCKDDLSEHLKQHAGRSSYRCQTCNKTFFDQNSLDIHEATHSLDQWVQGDRDKHVNKSSSNKFIPPHEGSDTPRCSFQCHLCRRTFLSRSNLNKHIKRHSDDKTKLRESKHTSERVLDDLSVKSNSNDTNKSPFTFNNQTVTYKSNNNPNIHTTTQLSNQNNISKVQNCERVLVFQNTDGKDTDANTSKSIHKPKQVVETAFSSKSVMKVNFERPAMENILSKETPSDKNVHNSTHQEEKRSPEQKVRCHLCMKLFSCKSNLKRHLRRSCDKAHFENRVLNKHETTVHTKLSCSPSHTTTVSNTGEHSAMSNETQTSSQSAQQCLPSQMSKSEHFGVSNEIPKVQQEHQSSFTSTTQISIFSIEKNSSSNTSQPHLQNNHIGKINLNQVNERPLININNNVGKGIISEKQRKRSQEQPINCHICLKSLSSRYSLNRHLKTHRDVLTYKCQTCDKLFYDEECFHKHEATHPSRRLVQNNLSQRALTNKVSKHNETVSKTYVAVHSAQAPVNTSTSSGMSLNQQNNTLCSNSNDQIVSDRVDTISTQNTITSEQHDQFDHPPTLFPNKTDEPPILNVDESMPDITSTMHTSQSSSQDFVSLGSSINKSGEYPLTFNDGPPTLYRMGFTNINTTQMSQTLHQDILSPGTSINQNRNQNGTPHNKNIPYTYTPNTSRASTQTSLSHLQNMLIQTSPVNQNSTYTTAHSNRTVWTALHTPQSSSVSQTGPNTSRTAFTSLNDPQTSPADQNSGLPTIQSNRVSLDEKTDPQFQRMNISNTLNTMPTSQSNQQRSSANQNSEHQVVCNNEEMSVPQPQRTSIPSTLQTVHTLQFDPQSLSSVNQNGECWVIYTNDTSSGEPNVTKSYTVNIPSTFKTVNSSQNGSQDGLYQGLSVNQKAEQQIIHNEISSAEKNVPNMWVTSQTVTQYNNSSASFVNEGGGSLLNPGQETQRDDETKTSIPTPEQPAMCHICDRTFANKRRLNTHLLTHVGKRQYNCKFCETKFFDKKSCDEHESKHTSDNRVQCGICHKMFSSLKCLRRHIKLHSGERPFRCNLCDKTFIEKCRLTIHEATHRQKNTTELV